MVFSLWLGGRKKGVQEQFDFEFFFQFLVGFWYREEMKNIERLANVALAGMLFLPFYFQDLIFLFLLMMFILFWFWFCVKLVF